jgi:hypothetical protein
VRYNQLDGGAMCVQICEAQDSVRFARATPAYRRSYVYRNLLVSDDANTVPYQVDYSRDTLGEPSWRKGICYFAYNTRVFPQSGQFNTIPLRVRASYPTGAAFDARGAATTPLPGSFPSAVDREYVAPCSSQARATVRTLGYGIAA